MSAADVVVLVAAVVACLAAIVGLATVAVLVNQVRRLEAAVETLRGEALAMVSEARRAQGAAADELGRVESVLEGTESVTATVDAASRLAHRAFSNPVVKVLALRAGAASGIRQLREPVPVRSGGRAR
jgi:hypothetical protein